MRARGERGPRLRRVGDRRAFARRGAEFHGRTGDVARKRARSSQLIKGKQSMSNRKEKKEENREGTQTSKHPNGYPQLEVFEKAATKKDDHNHPNSLQR